MPGRRDESGGASNRAGVPGAEGKIFAKQFALVGDHHHIVGFGALREGRDLLLDLFEPAVGSAAAGIVLERALVHDRRAKFLGRVAQLIGIGFVFWQCAGHQEPLGPFFPHQILG